MNWTGGSLTSSRNAKTSIVATQKKHFAKARKKIYHGHQVPLDLDFSIFEPNARITKKPSSQQASFDIWQAKMEEGIQNMPQNDQKKGNVTPSRLEPSNHHGSDDYDSDESTTLPSSVAHHQRLDEGGMSSSLAGDEFEAKKQELLAMRDWCGLESTRPVKMTFEDPADREMLGRRRRILTEKASPTEKRRSHHHRHQMRQFRRLSSHRPRTSQQHATSSSSIRSDELSE